MHILDQEAPGLSVGDGVSRWRWGQFLTLHSADIW
jgi:hypothetical protein